MKASTDLAEHIVRVMNELLAAEPETVEALVDARVPCGAPFERHPTVQVHADRVGSLSVGLLGVLNAVAGARPDGSGFIAAVYVDSRLERFEVRPG